MFARSARLASGGAGVPVGVATVGATLVALGPAVVDEEAVLSEIPEQPARGV